MWHTTVMKMHRMLTTGTWGTEMNWIAFAFMLAAAGLGWAVMIYGWGVQPESWAWIVGGTAGSVLLIGVGDFITKN